MSKKKILSDILAELIGATLFLIKYKVATDNLDGTYTLSGICDIRYIQPGFTITIDGENFLVSDYEKKNNDWNIILTKTPSAALPPLPAQDNVFQLYDPFFCHGTPIQTEDELTKIPLEDKTPMIYLMEPFETVMDYTFDTAIDRRCTFTLCFLTQADIPKWLTDDFYHKAITPMYNLAQDLINLLIESNLFCTVKQKGSPKFYTKFGINIKSTGTPKLYFSENLSGVGLDIHLDIYAEEYCCGTGAPVKVYTFIDNEFIQSSKLVQYLYATTPDNSKDPVLIGAVDGDGTGAGNTIFKLPAPFKAGSVELTVDGSYQRDFTENILTNEITLSWAPIEKAVVSVKYIGVT